VGARLAVAAAVALAAAPPGVAAARDSAGSVATGAAACANTSLVPSAHDTAQVGGAIVCLINAIRTSHGLAPLAPSGALNASALGHSRDMVARGYFSHDTPSGSTPAQRMLRHGVACPNGCALGENIAWASGSYSTPAAIVQAWMGSPGHRANILDPVFRYEGLGVAEGSPRMLANGQNGTTVTQDFAS
jgi:uncharacterized protein YkwD